MKKYLLSYSLKAKKDITYIYNFIAMDNPVEARKHVNYILDKIENLREFPELGKRVSRTIFKSQNIRMLLVSNVRVIYLVADKINAIKIIHVVKDSQNIERILFSSDLNKLIQGDFSNKKKDS